MWWSWKSSILGRFLVASQSPGLALARGPLGVVRGGVGGVVAGLMVGLVVGFCAAAGGGGCGCWGQCRLVGQSKASKRTSEDLPTPEGLRVVAGSMV